MTAPAIDLKNVRVTAGGRAILNLERLQIEQGEVFAILGPNGAGKTTLLKTCLGFCRPNDGDVRVLGENVSGLGRWGLTRLRRRIGYVPQDLAARSEMPLTCREVVAIGRTGRARLFSRLGREDWREVDDWIDRLGLSALAEKGYGDLSGGEQRKTLIARAMVQEPEMLILDEPTAHLDLGWREQIVRTLQNLYGQSGITILLVCHELEVVPPCCNQLAILEGGRMTAVGRPTDVLTTERVCRLYGEGFDVTFRAGRCLVMPTGGEA
jgi:iron complex transport system ATP-binding protein